MKRDLRPKADVTRDDLQRRFFAQRCEKKTYFALHLRVFDFTSKIRNVHAAEVKVALKIVLSGMLYGINLALRK